MKITQIPTPLLGGPSNGGSVSLKPALGAGPTGPTGGTGPTGPQGPPGPGTGAGAWQPSTAYTANQVVQAPDGSMISRNATGTSRASFDATEQAAWTAVVGKAGTVAASALSDSIAQSAPVVITPEKYGAVGDGVADDTTAVVNAFAAATALRVVGLGGNIYHPGATVNLRPGRTYKLATLSAAIEASCNIIGQGATLIAPDAYATSVLLIGHATSGKLLHDADMTLPNVRKADSVSTLTAGSIGVQVQNLHHSRVKFGRVARFETGHWYTGYGQGTVYNVITPGWIDLCKVGHKFTPRTGGWVNQNTFTGGGISQSANTFDGGSTSDVRRPGWRHVLIDGTGGGGTINANTFVGVSYEGDLSELHFDVKYATNNVWMGGTRFEQGTAARSVTLSTNTWTSTAHGLAVGDMVVFLNAGTRPLGLLDTIPYWVSSVPSADTFTVAETKGGPNVSFGTNGSGVVYYVPPRIQFDGTGLNTNDNIIRAGYYSYPGPLDVRLLNRARANTVEPATPSLGTLMAGRNRLINGDFRVNQRGYASGTTVAGDVYTFDRWKTLVASTALTFTSAPNGQRITLAAGQGIVQVVERANIEAGTYTLSWRGSVKGRVYRTGDTAPSYLSSPVTVDLDGTTSVRVELTATDGVSADVGEVQLERGSIQTPFERVHLGAALIACQRYFQRIGAPTGSLVREAIGVGAAFGTTTAWVPYTFPVPMRVAPTLTVTDTVGSTVRLVSNGSVYYVSSVVAAPVTTAHARLTFTSSGLTGGLAYFADTGDSNALLDFSAEL